MKGTMVKGSSEGDISLLDKFEYFEPVDNQFHELKGDTFGPAEGFPLSNATSKFRATFKEPGETTVTFILSSVETGEAVIKLPVTFKCVESNAYVAKIAEEAAKEEKKAVKSTKSDTKASAKKASLEKSEDIVPEESDKEDSED